LQNSQPVNTLRYRAQEREGGVIGEGVWLGLVRNLSLQGMYIESALRHVAGRVSDMDFGLAALPDLGAVTAGAKPRKESLSLSFSRRPQHGM
jgi:hypothetical protein